MENDQIEPDDDGGFLIRFPCYTLLYSNTNSGVLHHFPPDGTTAVVILTDEDLLLRHRDRPGLKDTAAWRMENPRHLWDFLKAVPKPVANVVFDPPDDPNSIIYHNIEAMLRELSQREGFTDGPNPGQ